MQTRAREAERRKAARAERLALRRSGKTDAAIEQVFEARAHPPPSALEETQSATISLTHPKLGEWVYSARGVGHVPADMPTTTPSAHRAASGEDGGASAWLTASSALA